MDIGCLREATDAVDGNLKEVLPELTCCGVKPLALPIPAIASEISSARRASRQTRAGRRAGRRDAGVMLRWPRRGCVDGFPTWHATVNEVIEAVFDGASVFLAPVRASLLGALSENPESEQREASGILHDEVWLREGRILPVDAGLRIKGVRPGAESVPRWLATEASVNDAQKLSLIAAMEIVDLPEGVIASVVE